MLAAYWNALHEGVNRRMALVLYGIALLVDVAFNLLVHFRHLPDGSRAFSIGTQFAIPATIAVPTVLESELRATGTLWLLLTIFAATPLLVSTIERGWLELTFSKGTGRSAIFLGRFLGGVTMYSVAFLLAAFPLALRLWWLTGIGTWRMSFALVIQTFSFAAILSVAALVTQTQKGVALPIIASVSVWLLAPVLAARQIAYAQLFSSHIARGILECAYDILPKSTELESLCVSYVQTGTISSWWPVWTTALFLVAVLGLTLWQLEHKSF